MDVLISTRRTFGMRDPSLGAFRGRHAGEACFIVGNGPSVRMGDLDAIAAAGVESFGANRIPDIFPGTAWRPSYMCVMDGGFLTGAASTTGAGEYLSLLEAEGVHHVFMNGRLRRWVPRALRSGVLFVDVPEASLFRTNLAPFSDDAALYVSDLGSVTHFSIQLACFMGYKEIYLYGVDDSYTKYLGVDGLFHVDGGTESHVEGMRHMEDDAHVDHAPRTEYEAYRMRGFADLRKTSLGYAACREYAESHGVAVVNATRGGKLNAFAREDLDDVLGRLQAGRSVEG